jgi:O-methyltransferase involved in polyketide biosynthesis
MSDKIAVDLGNVQKTLFLPLWGRAVESQKKHPMLVDPTALEIIASVDFDFTTLSKKINPLSQTAWIMRSIYIDQVVNTFLAAHPHGSVVNIGCGLDTTFERTDNGLLTWYDLDLPDVIALRKLFVKANDRRQLMAGSFLEEDWLNSLDASNGILFIAAGVLYYYEENQVKEFFIRIANRFPGSEIIFDASSPTGIKLANRAVIKSSGLDEKSYLKWGLKHADDLLAWDERFKLINSYHYFACKDISLPLRLMGSLSDLLMAQYMLHIRL